MRSDRGVVGIAVLWLLVGVSALGYSALRLARWQKSRAATGLAEVQARLLIAGSALLAREAQFKFLEKNDTYETGTVRLVRAGSTNPAEVTLHGVATVAGFQKHVNIGWKKIPNGWGVSYWAEP
jgi:Tfp pilus assembly protein PilX